MEWKGGNVLASLSATVRHKQTVDDKRHQQTQSATQSAARRMPKTLDGRLVALAESRRETCKKRRRSSREERRAKIIFASRTHLCK
jgi:hypothetical protein